MFTRPFPRGRCLGTLPRRAFLQAGLAGWGSLGLADLLRCESAAANAASSTANRRKKSMIVVWLWGGPSHMETFDLKPDAPLEYRGEFRPIGTNVPGIDVCEHLHRRGLLDDVLVAVLGEMSHTPRLSNFNGQPGRENWARSMSIFLAGGGLRMGQVIGATTAKGDEPAERPLSPNDLQATWYHYLGVPLDTRFSDHFGRPIPILSHGSPIHELVDS